MSAPARLDTARHLCGCGNTATVRYHARGPHEYRAIQACAHCAPKARAWTARAGPVRETQLAPDQPPEAREEELSTLF